MSTPRRREPVSFDPGKLRKVRPRELAIRFGFGALVSGVAALIGKQFGPLAGGVFLAFPAILPATLTLVEQKEGTKAARHDSRGAVAGVFGLAAFALVVRWQAERPAVALVAAGAAWVVVAVASYFLWRAARTAAGLEESMPETEATGPSTVTARAARDAADRRQGRGRVRGTPTPSGGAR